MKPTLQDQVAADDEEPVNGQFPKTQRVENLS
jgi:hypothetical protein